MTKSLTHRDILDLEYFLQSDKGENHDSLHQRDREIYLTYTGDKNTNSILLHWLQVLRKKVFEANGAISPGTILSESLRLLSFILPGCGLIGGLLSGFTFFTYTGETPVNVFHFLALFIFSQLLILLLLLTTSFLRLCLGVNRSYSMTTRFYSSLIARLASRIQSGIAKSVSTEKHNNYHQTIGLIQKAGFKYGSLMFWSFFILSQKIVIAVNAGLLLATLFQITTSDLAFGWQSTISFSSDALFVFVQTIAWPWSWLLPEHFAYPSIDAIEGSRIILKDGIYNLTTQDLIAWWPFLVFCLIFYGLLLRLGLLTIGHFLQTYSFKKLKIDTPDVSRILQRMSTPLVSAQATPANPQAEYDKHTVGRAEATTRDQYNNTKIPVIVLIPDDIAEESSIAKLDSLLARHGFNMTQRENVMQGYETDQTFFQQLATKSFATDTTVFLVMESWMPPIGDLFRFLKMLRLTLPPVTPIYIGLLERGGANITSYQSSAQDFKIWKQKIDSLGDPYLDILMLNHSHNPTEKYG